MDIDEDNTASTSDAASSSPARNEPVVSAIDAMSLQTVQPVIAPVAPTPVIAPVAATPVIPPIAPIPQPVLRPLAPIPVRPPVVRPPLAPKGDSRTSDSDEEGSGLNRTSAGQEYEISEESKLVRERQEKAVQELLMKRRAAALAVPTNDKAVRARLRRLGEPITLFGEREMERRDRLRALLAKLDSEGQLEKLMKAHEDEEASATAAPPDPEEDIRYPFYTEGSQSLLEARREIARYSIVKSALRLHRARRRKDDPDEDLDAEVDWSLKQAANLVLECSEIGDDRPLSGCSISHDGKMLATW